MRFHKTNIFLVVCSLLSFALSFLFAPSSDKSDTLRHFAEQIASRLQKQENELHQLLNDSIRIGRLATRSFAAGRLEEITGQDFALFIYRHDSLLFWNNDDIPFHPSFSGYSGEPAVIKMENGYFEIISRKYPAYDLTGLIPVRYDFPVQNQYLRDGFYLQDIPLEIKISLEPAAGSSPVKAAGGKILFYIFFGESYSAIGYVDILFSFLALIFLFLFLFGIARSFQGIAGFLFLFLVSGCIRWLMIEFDFPREAEKLLLFHPQFYASSGVAGSPGDLLINVLLAFSLALFFYFKTSLPKPGAQHKFFTWLTVSAIYGIIFLLADWAVEVLKSLVIDSRISFELHHIFSLGFFSITGFICFTLILFTFFLLAHRLALYLYAENSIPFTFHLLGIAATLAVYFLITFDWLTFLIAAFVLVYLWLVSINVIPKAPFQQFGFQGILMVMILFSFASSLLLNFLNQNKEIENRKVFAAKLANERDPIFEYIFNTSYNDLATDAVLKEYFVTGIPFTEHLADSLQEYILRRHFSGLIAKKYDIVVMPLADGERKENLAFHAGDSLTADKTLLHSYKSNTRYGRLTETFNPYLFHYSEKGGSYAYYARMPVYHQNRLEGILHIEFAPKKLRQSNVYPELLLDEKAKLSPGYEQYDYAIYKESRLIDQQGIFPYSLSLPLIKTSGQEYHLYTSRGFSHLIYQSRNSLSVIVSLKENTWLVPLALFSHIFCLLLVLMLLVYFVFFAVSIIRKPSRLRVLAQSSLKFKIQFAIIFTLVFSFILIASVTIYNLQGHYQAHHTEDLIEKIKTLASEVESAIGKEEAGVAAFREIENDISAMGAAHSSDINLFRKSGTLVASSQPEIFSKGLQSMQMHPLAFYYLDRRQQTVFFHHENIGLLKFLSAYVPLKNNDGKVIAYLNLPYYSDEKDLKNEIAVFVNLLINIYVLLLVVAGIIALLLSKSMTRPLSLVGERMKQISFTRKNEPIAWEAEDEIGALVKEYNKMILELEKSALQLAKSERESAWREMAKQVAHEIKNPLTTMRLRIQHLQRAYMDNAANLREMTEKTVATLMEQIDNLTNIATAFSSFAQMPKANNEEVNLNELLRNVAELFVNNEKNAMVAYHLPAETCKVFADKNQLLQVMNNLVKNAIQSLPDDRQGKIFIAMETIPGNALIKVSDNGSGIAAELRDKIFLPNFTTKSSGMGLGLAITRNIIENMKGSIWFESEENKGATFFVELPI